MVTAHLPSIYLASSSPRRQELLAQIGIEYNVINHHVEEKRLEQESAEAMVKRLAIAKAKDAAHWLGQRPVRPVLGADTIVVIEEEVLGKPVDKADALRMLSLLSDRTHSVVSAIAVVSGNQVLSRVHTSQVTFAKITPEEALTYWETGEPVGKAGAYAVQGMAGIFIKRIEGSYSSIMGLPLYETYTLLQELVLSDVKGQFV